jgi:cytochrome c oxidase subunit 6b
LYNQYVLCQKSDADSAACKQMRKNANSICPNAWVERWDEERANGNFPGVQ